MMRLEFHAECNIYCVPPAHTIIVTGGDQVEHQDIQAFATALGCELLAVRPALEVDFQAHRATAVVTFRTASQQFELRDRSEPADSNAWLMTLLQVDDPIASFADANSGLSRLPVASPSRMARLWRWMRP